MSRQCSFKKLALGAAITVAVMAATAPAAIAATVLLSFTSSGGDVGSLRLGINGTTATSASGKINGQAITGLSTYAGSDQQFFAAGPTHFTVPGISFSAKNGINYNLTAYPDYADRITNSLIDPPGYGNPTPYLLTSLTVAPAAVPVPAAGLLLAGGIGGLAMLRRRRSA